MVVRLSQMTLQEVKENFIIDVATNLFFTRSISSVTIKDIAEEAGVGEMTIYRYFKKKHNIVLAVAMKLQQQVAAFFDLSKGSTGFEKLSIFYNSYLKIFMSSPMHYRFINEFDAYMLEFNDNQGLEKYESSLDFFKTAYLDAYQLGLKDQTIRDIGNVELFYYTSTHSLLELCKKLSLNNELLNQDKRSVKYQEIETLINVFLTYLKNS
ncbi:MAG: TetR/AcrR family transcriptional regulator [Bacilli bacterium]|nr:TetR/AcrR family transcriptional regulator [Bacilli bacterium]